MMNRMAFLLVLAVAASGCGEAATTPAADAGAADAGAVDAERSTRELSTLAWYGRRRRHGRGRTC